VFLAAVRNQDSVEARELLERVRERHPDDFWLNFKLAQILAVWEEDYVESRDRSRQEEVIGYYRAALAVKPDSQVVLHNLGLALLTRKVVEGAIRCFRKALRLDPRDTKARINLAWALLTRPRPGK
jgi:tetratricopeptide (TPR) repeat protein